MDKERYLSTFLPQTGSSGTIRFTVTDAFTDENKSSYNDISVMIDNDLPVLSISSGPHKKGQTLSRFNYVVIFQIMEPLLILF